MDPRQNQLSPQPPYQQPAYQQPAYQQPYQQSVAQQPAPAFKPNNAAAIITLLFAVLSFLIFLGVRILQLIGSIGDLENGGAFGVYCLAYDVVRALTFDLALFFVMLSFSQVRKGKKLSLVGIATLLLAVRCLGDLIAPFLDKIFLNAFYQGDFSNLFDFSGETVITMIFSSLTGIALLVTAIGLFAKSKVFAILTGVFYSAWCSVKMISILWSLIGLTVSGDVAQYNVGYSVGYAVLYFAKLVLGIGILLLGIFYRRAKK